MCALQALKCSWVLLCLGTIRNFILFYFYTFHLKSFLNGYIGSDDVVLSWVTVSIQCSYHNASENSSHFICWCRLYTTSALSFRQESGRFLFFLLWFHIHMYILCFNCQLYYKICIHFAKSKSFASSKQNLLFLIFNPLIYFYL